jgi:L,D-transpeptidase catalytic domain
VVGVLTGAAVGAGAVATPAAASPPIPPSGRVAIGAAVATGSSVAPSDPTSCPASAHGAVVDRVNQRMWLCTDGRIVRLMSITSARDQPDPGDYAVYAEDVQTTSWYGGHQSTLDRFVAFTRGKYQGARIGFHAVPRLRDGSLAQPLESVGTQAMFGASSGCVRVRPADAVSIWDHLAVGDLVRVIS